MTLSGETTNVRLRAATPSKFDFVGGHLAIDFVNTGAHQGADSVERLVDFGDLVAWLSEAGVLPLETAQTLRTDNMGTREARRVLNEARAFRATLGQLLERGYAHRTIGPSIVGHINGLLNECQCRRHIVPRDGGFAITVLHRFQRPADLLMPLANAAADVLASLDLSMIKRCKNDECMLFFYDTSKNHSRAWCSMQICGNRKKAAAHYRRLKAFAS